MNAVEMLNVWSLSWSTWIFASLVDGLVVASLAGLLWLAIRRFSSAQFGYVLFLLVLARLVFPLPVSAPPSLAWLSPSHAVEGVKSRWFGPRSPQRPADLKFAPAHALPTWTAATSPRGTDVLSSTPPAAQRTSLSARAMLMLAWAATVVLLLGRFGWVQWRWSRLLCSAERLDSHHLPVGMEELGRRLRLRRDVPVVVYAAIGSPAVWGVWRPRLILPAELAEQLTKSELTWVLLHELAHVRRGDLIVALVQRLAQIAYFFHPAVWLVNLAIDRQREYACDDAASAAAGCSPRECGAALVSVIERACGAAPVAALGLFQSRAFLRRRIMRLVNQRGAIPLRPSRASFALLFALAVVVLPRLNASGEPAAIEAAAPAAKATADRQSGVRDLALADEPEKASDEKPTGPDAPPRDATEPVSLSGRAIDQDGNPVADAVIYLASLAKANRIFAKTVTDAQGRYDFRNALLPIAKLSAAGEPEYCVFQVFGRKQGLGFAWSRRRWFFVHAFAENLQDAAGRLGPQERYHPGDKIDLTFSPSARLYGQVVDDRGAPLKGVELIIWGCQRLSSPHFGWSEHFEAISNALLSPALVPTEMRIRETDDDGRFEFDDLPAECRFRIRVRTANGPTREIWAATTDAPQPVDSRSPEILSGELKLIFPKPFEVPFQILFGDTGLPAAKVLVRTYDQSGLGNRGTTDEQGRVTLRLPPGQHKIDLSPIRGTPYFSTPHILNPVPVGFEVGTEPREKPLVFRLRPAAAVDVTVVDAETGEGIPYVDFWEQLAPNDPLSRGLPAFQSWDPETGTIWAPPPLTDANGKLRALLEEGEHRVGVGLRSIPPGYEAVEADGLLVDCRIGKPVQLKFNLRKRKLPSGDQTGKLENTIGAETPTERLPIMDGIVLREKNGAVELSLGADDGIRRGHVLFWYRDGAQLGRLTIVSTTPDKSIAKYTPNPKSGAEVGPPKPDDLISTRAK